MIMTHGFSALIVEVCFRLKLNIRIFITNSYPLLLSARLKRRYWKRCGLVALRQRLQCFHGKHYLVDYPRDQIYYIGELFTKDRRPHVYIVMEVQNKRIIFWLHVQSQKKFGIGLIIGLDFPRCCPVQSTRFLRVFLCL